MYCPEGAQHLNNLELSKHERSVLTRLDGSGRYAGLSLAHQLQNISSTSKREGEAGAALSVGVHNFAKLAVLLLAKLALDADILAADRPQALHERLGVKLRVLETGDEAVASVAHATNLGAVECQVQLVLVGLRDTWEHWASASARLSQRGICELTTQDQSAVIARDDEDNATVFVALSVVVGDNHTLKYLHELNVMVSLVVPSFIGRSKGRSFVSMLTFPRSYR